MHQMTKNKYTQTLTTNESTQIYQVFIDYLESKNIDTSTINKDYIINSLKAYSWNENDGSYDNLDVIYGIIVIFESYLSEYKIDIPNQERDHDILDNNISKEEAAIIYGDDFYQLEAEIASVLDLKIYN